MKLAAGLLLVAVIAGQGVDGKRQLRGERGRHLITLKQAMGVGKKFQERWNNGYLYDDDDDLGGGGRYNPNLIDLEKWLVDDYNFPNLARRRTKMSAAFCKYCVVHGKFSEIQCNAWCR